MQDGIYQELVVVLALAVGIILLFRRMKMPGVLGFIIAGMLAGPHMLGWVDKTETVNMLAEFGMVFLLFVIGMGFSLKKLAAIGVTVFVGGSLQVLFTVGLTTGICTLLGMALAPSIFIGFLVTLSSTAIVLRVLQEKGQLDAPFGRITAAILIFQDILVVPMMLMMPLLAGKSGNIAGDLVLLLGKMLLLMVVVYIGGRWVVPWLLRMVSKGRNKELFIITVVLICFAATWGTSALGLSLALGAFFAGLIISGTDQVDQASGIVKPFHQVFMSFFFVSIGMLVDPAFFLSSPLLIIGSTLLVLLIKTLTGFLSVWLLRHPVRTALQCGLSLFQVGEFSFILALSGISFGLLTAVHHQLFLAVSILSMAATPLVMARAGRVVDKTFNDLLPSTGKRLDALLKVVAEDRITLPSVLKDHLVIIGFGLNGQNLAFAAQSTKIRCAVIEDDPDLAELARKQGIPVIQGNATDQDVLEKARLRVARAIVVAVPDADHTRRVIAAVRNSTTSLLIVRTRFEKDIASILDAGANEVVSEEFETSIQMLQRVLRKYAVPDRTTLDLVDHIRERRHGTRGRMKMEADPHADRDVTDIQQVVPIDIPVDIRSWTRDTFIELEVQGRYGITLWAIERDGRMIRQENELKIVLPGDIVYVVGSMAGIGRFQRALKRSGT